MLWADADDTMKPMGLEKLKLSKMDVNVINQWIYG